MFFNQPKLNTVSSTACRVKVHARRIYVWLECLRDVEHGCVDHVTCSFWLLGTHTRKEHKDTTGDDDGSRGVVRVPVVRVVFIHSIS